MWTVINALWVIAIILWVCFGVKMLMDWDLDRRLEKERLARKARQEEIRKLMEG